MNKEVMKIVGVFVFSLAMLGCQKEHTLPPKIEEEVVEPEPYPFNKILGTYSGQCIVTEGSGNFITDDPDGASSYEDVTTTKITLEIVKAGLDTIAFLPDSLFQTTPDYYKFGRNIFPIYPTFPAINLTFHVANYSYSHKARFEGADLQLLTLKTIGGYSESNPSGSSYSYTKREYTLTKIN